MAIFLPDAWSAAPTKIEFEELQTVLRRQLDDKLAAIDSPPSVSVAAVNDQDHSRSKPAVPMSSPSQQQQQQQQVESGRCWPVESIDSSVRVRFVLSFPRSRSDDVVARAPACYFALGYHSFNPAMTR